MGSNGVGTKSGPDGPDEHPDESCAATQSPRTQPARTSLVLGVRLDQTVEGPREVNGHGNASFWPIRPDGESRDYAESLEPINSRKPLVSRAFDEGPQDQLRIVQSSA